MKRISLYVTSLICLSLSLSGCGGSSSGADVQPNIATESGPVRYSGPVPANGDVAAFQLHLWSNIVDRDRCGALTLQQACADPGVAGTPDLHSGRDTWPNV